MAPSDDLDVHRHLHCSCAHTEMLSMAFELGTLWDEYEIISDVVVSCNLLHSYVCQNLFAMISAVHECLSSCRHLSLSVPRAKAQSLNSTSSTLSSLHHPHSGQHMLCRLVPITPNQVPCASPHHICCYGQNPGQKAPPWPCGCGGLLRSHGHHVTIVQPYTTQATSSAGHLAGGPGT